MKRTEHEKSMMVLSVLLNLLGCLGLVYFGYLFISGSTVVDAPEAMLPMERWERGGWALTIGTIPLMIANAMGYTFMQWGNRKSRLLIFMPSVVCVVLVICYWMKSLG